MELFQRNVLGFYDSKDCGEYINSKTCHLVELPLNYSGLVIDYIDINEEISKIKKVLKKYSRIIFWVGKEKNEKYLQIKEFCKGKKVLELDDSFIGVNERGKMYWGINPIKFFEKFFELEDFPKVDVSVINGNRIFFSNIDGDLFCRRSSLGGFNGEIILNKVLRKYSFPFTVSWVVSEIENKQELIGLAKKIILLDNVEGASHSSFHPSDWRKNHYPIDLDKEIDYSVEYLNKHVAPPNKPIRMFLWAGLGNPTSEGLKKVYELKIKNFNGGYNVMRSCGPDPLCFLPPYVYKLGGHVQFNCRSLNESSFSNTPVKNSNFSRVIHVFERTDNSDFTLPINLYFHWYSGSNEDNLVELLKVLNWVSKQNTTPVFTSEYVDMLKDFLSIQIFKEEASWVVMNKGYVRTVRFDDCDRHINFEKSENIIGYCHRKKSLYVFLNEEKKHKIELQEEEPGLENVYLKNANRILKNWSVKNREVMFQTEGKGLLKFKIAVKPGKYLLKIRNKGRGEESVIETKKNVLDYNCTIDISSLITIKPLENAISPEERISSVNKWSRMIGLNNVFYLPEKVKFSINTAKADCKVIEGEELIRISTEDMPEEEFNQLVLHEAAHILRSKLKSDHLKVFKKRLPSMMRKIRRYHKKAKNVGDKISPLDYLLLENEIFARLLNYVTIKGRPEYEVGEGKKPWHLLNVFDDKDAESILHVLPQEFQEAYKNDRLKEYFDKASQNISNNCAILKSKNDIKEYKIFFSEETFKKSSETEIRKVLNWLRKNNLNRIYLYPAKNFDYDIFKKIIEILKENKFKLTLLTDGLFDNRILNNVYSEILTDCIINLKSLAYPKEKEILKNNLSSLEKTFIRINILHDFPLTGKTKKEVLDLFKEYSIRQILINFGIEKNSKIVIKEQLNSFIDYLKSFTKQKTRVSFEGNIPYCCLPKKEVTFLKNKKVNLLRNSIVIDSNLKVANRNIEEFNNLEELRQQYRDTKEDNLFEDCLKCVYKKRNLC